MEEPFDLSPMASVFKSDKKTNTKCEQDVNVFLDYREVIVEPLAFMKSLQGCLSSMGPPVFWEGDRLKDLVAELEDCWDGDCP